MLLQYAITSRFNDNLMPFRHTIKIRSQFIVLQCIHVRRKSVYFPSKKTNTFVYCCTNKNKFYLLNILCHFPAQICEYKAPRSLTILSSVHLNEKIFVSKTSIKGVLVICFSFH